MNSLKSIFLVGFLLAGVTSCCECTEWPSQPVFEVQDFSLLNIDNNGSWPVLSESRSLNRNAFGMAIVFERRKGQAVSLRDTYPLDPFQPMCCKKGRPSAWAVEYVRIYTLTDFDEAHTAGSEVTDYFQVVTGSATRYLSYMQLNDLMTGVFHNSFDSNGNYVMPVLLMNPPSTPKAAQFKVVVKFWYIQEEFEKVSNPVTLQ